MDAEGLTPLLHACWGRSPGCVKQLLESAGADPNQADFCGETPAMVAARLGDVELLNLLISHGCDLSLRDENDWDAPESEGQGAVARKLSTRLKGL